MSKNIQFEYEGMHFDVQVKRDGDTLTITNEGNTSHVHLIPEVPKATPKKNLPKKELVPPPAAQSPIAKGESTGGKQELAPLPGTISEIKVSRGQQVQSGDLIMIMEAMKMYIEVFATGSGSVQSILVHPGDSVFDKQPLLKLA